MTVALFRALVDGVRAALAAHPETFEVRAFAGRTKASAARLDAVAAALGVALPPLLCALHRELPTPWGFGWSVRAGGALDADTSPSGLLELVATKDLRWARGVAHVLRITNDGHGNGYALDYRRRGAAEPRREAGGIVWYDHDAATVRACEAKTLEALLTAWAADLFVSGAPGDADLDPLRALLVPAPKAARAPRRGLTELALPRGAEVRAVALDDARVFIAFPKVVWIYDLARGDKVAEIGDVASPQALALLPDGRLVVCGLFGAEVVTWAEGTRGAWFEDGAPSRLVPLDDGVLALAPPQGVVLDAEGAPRLTFQVPPSLMSVVALADRFVMSTTTSPPELVCIDRHTGARRWSVTEPALAGPPCLVARGDEVLTTLVGGGLVAWDRDGRRTGALPREAVPHVSSAVVGDRLVSGGLGVLEVLDHDGRLVATVALAPQRYVRVHARGRRVVVTADARAYLYTPP